MSGFSVSKTGSTAMSLALEPSLGRLPKNTYSRFVAKLLRPAFATGGEDPYVMVYNKSNTIMIRCRMTDDLMALFGSRFKMYRWAQVRNGKLIVEDGANEQPW